MGPGRESKCLHLHTRGPCKLPAEFITYKCEIIRRWFIFIIRRAARRGCRLNSFSPYFCPVIDNRPNAADVSATRTSIVIKRNENRRGFTSWSCGAQRVNQMNRSGQLQIGQWFRRIPRFILPVIVPFHRNYSFSLGDQQCLFPWDRNNFLEWRRGGNISLLFLRFEI